MSYNLKRRRSTPSPLAGEGGATNSCCLLRQLPFILMLSMSLQAEARDIHYGAVTDAGVLACDKQQWRGQRDAANRCYQALLTPSSSLSVRAEVAWALGDFKSANDLFSAAAKQRPSAALLSRWGELYADTHQNSEALKLFNEALQVDGNYAFAQVGAASVLVDQFAAQAGEYLQPVLEGNAVPGAKLRALLLSAWVNLENGDLDKAAEQLKQATEAATAAQLPQLEIYALQASLELLRTPTSTDVASSSWVKKALAENPAYGDIYAIPAHFYVITRRTREASELYRRAVEVQPDNWDARVEYGSSLLRDNQITQAREQMEAAYKGDPFNVITVNTLRLLDSLKNFDVLMYPDPASAQGAREQAPIVLRLHKKESAVLGPYARKLTENAIASFSKQYNFQLKEPVVIEVYPDHEDFAVRTAGEPGLGLLGVTFGYVVAMDSPSSRAIDEFHWGSTLWHELAHVFTLESTEHRVPRWFSEGISVYEEWNTGPISGVNAKGVIIPSYVYEAFKDGKALPIAELDRGFIRPEFPQQVLVSYMQAGLICEFIKREFGAAKLNDMLVQFKQGADTEKAVQNVFKLQPAEFDKRFNVFMQGQFKTLFAKYDVWIHARSTTLASYRRSEWNTVIQAAQEALAILPNDVEDGSPYVALARAYNATGKADQAQSTLETYLQYGGHDPEALRWLATRLRTQNKLAQAAQVLDAINYVAPFNYEVHGELGETLLALKRPQDALTEFEVALKLNPPDKASAYYRIAQAMKDLQRTAEAKRNVLLALEVAPGFKPAQQLLLELAKTK